MRTPAHLLLAVFVGGAVGTLARVWLASATTMVWLDGATTAFVPMAASLHVLDSDIIAALVANIAGSFVLGVVAGAHWPPRLAALRAGIGPGFCGGFTTFSLIALALAVAFSTSAWAIAAFLIGTVGGILAIVVGRALGRLISPEPGAGQSAEDDADSGPDAPATGPAAQPLAPTTPGFAPKGGVR